MEENEDMEVEEDNNRFSNAIVVDTVDLDRLNIPITEDNEEDNVVVLEELRQVDFSSESFQPSIENEFEDEEEEENDNQAMGELVRKTNAYLQGQVSFPELAAVIEEYQCPTNKDDGSKSSAMGFNYPSKRGRPVKKPRKDSVESTSSSLLESGAVPSTSAMSSTASVNIKDEFYRTGSETKSFTVRRRKKMPPTLQGLIGEAHVRFARGDYESTIEICMEIIKEEPTLVEPFSTLAMVYDTQGRTDKCLQFSLIAAYLNPRQCTEWHHLAEMSMEEGSISQAILCFNKAVTYDSQNVELHFQRADVLQRAGDLKGAIKGYQKILFLDTRTPAVCVEVLRRLAMIHHQAEDMNKAFESLKTAFRDFPSFVTSIESNLILELCITMEKFVEAIEILTTYVGVKFDPPLEKSDFESREAMEIALSSRRITKSGYNIHKDIKQKMILVLIHLECYSISNLLIANLRSLESIDEFGESYFEIGEAYMVKKKYEAATAILEPLVLSEKFSQAAIWLRYAECLLCLEKLEEAEIAYQTVLKSVPDHKVAKLNLSTILQKLGRYEESLMLLNQSEMQEAIDIELLMERCYILIQKDMLKEFYEAVIILLSRHCLVIRSLHESQVIVNALGATNMHDIIATHRKNNNESVNDRVATFVDKADLDIMSEWTLYLKLCRTLIQKERFDLLSRLTYTAASSKLFHLNNNMLQDLELHCFFASVMNKDQENMNLIFKKKVNQCESEGSSLNPMLINLFALGLNRCDPKKLSRQLTRMRSLFPLDTKVLLLVQNMYFIQGDYRIALQHCNLLSTLDPDNPLVPLMSAVNLLHLIAQKTAKGKKHMIVYLLAFLGKYAQLRGHCQEVFYNLGRFYQFFALNHYAVVNYERALECPPLKRLTEEDMVEAPHNQVILDIHYRKDFYDLSRETAYNLSALYLKSGDYDQARYYLHHYNVY